MAEAQQKTGDYFGTFLDAVKDQETTAGDEINDRLRSLLTALVPGPQRIWELQKATGLPYPEFAAELEAARTSGYVEVSGPSGEERLSLTASGDELASRLQSP